MGRGRPQKATQKQHDEKIRHGIDTSSSKRTQGQQRNVWTTSEVLSMAREKATAEEKGKVIQTEQWPELPKSKGSRGSGNITLEESKEESDQARSTDAQRKLNLTEEKAGKVWTNLFETNKLAARGMNLTYIPIIVEGEKVVQILLEDVKEDENKWKNALVVYVIGTTPSIGAMKRFITSQGTYTTKPEILYHVDGYFVIKFGKEEEKEKVLCAGPQYLMKRPIIMKPWSSDFNFKEEILTTVPLWIKLPNLPLNCWNSMVLSKIGSSLGQPLYADECTT